MVYILSFHRVFLFFLCIGLATFLCTSWLFPFGQPFWSSLDRNFFFYVNGWLATEQQAWQIFWAIANHRAFDLIPAFLMLFIYSHFLYAGGKSLFIERLSIGVFIAVYCIFIIQLGHIGFDFERRSPSEILAPAHRLSQLVPWIAAKDSSANSFPGDHAAVLLLVSTCMFFYAGWRYGTGCLMIAVLFSIPRLVGGAHWLTDIMVGSVTLALVGGAFAFLTPLHCYTLQFIKRHMNSGFSRLAAHF